ncbi:endonuclease/exonuclease/phosphatase family protein [Chitinophaga horti]|uniref:Endonuclease/exonuclease/phosphatase family protein n=1 Tax=Chitinophaga horti TaxID=2920382 RepID=A0ABY6J1A1_9BACT|nr:endonuclease/exonuclease/phosphatase family protein [Chitinophaga horti]UYQ91922.1 endonuclease/exonuclease/phosphatase family protein [Chitinophaga horti]
MIKRAIYMLAAISLLACNKDPYMPDNPPTYVDLGEGNAVYGTENDEAAKLASIKYMTYNIHASNPPGAPGTVDVNAIVNVIAQANPDVVLLQEVDKGTGRNNYTGDMAKEIATALKMNYFFYSSISYMRGLYGVAILSKYPLSNSRKYMLPKATPADEQRVLGVATVDLPGIDSMVLAVTHLQHTSDGGRLAQVNEVISQLSNVKGPVLIGGDFNENLNATDFFNVFDAVFTRTCATGTCTNTSSAQNPTVVIDHLAFRPAAAFSIMSHTVIPERIASDHFPVLAELKFNR